MSADDRGITQCKLWDPYSLCISWPSLTPVNLPLGGANGSPVDMLI